jgi:hypothetical protein
LKLNLLNKKVRAILSYIVAERVKRNHPSGDPSSEICITERSVNVWRLGGSDTRRGKYRPMVQPDLNNHISGLYCTVGKRTIK